jgi:hypothetical protein
MPTSTFRYSIYLWGYMLSGLICSMYLDTGETIKTVANTLCATALLSIPAQYHYPQDGIAPGWTGLYGEKNHLGIGMTIAIIALLLPQTKWNMVRVAKVALCTALLFLSQSGTAIVCALFCAILLLCLRAPQRLRRLVLALASGSAVIAFTLIPDLLDRLLAMGGNLPGEMLSGGSRSSSGRASRFLAGAFRLSGPRKTHLSNNTLAGTPLIPTTVFSRRHLPLALLVKC